MEINESNEISVFEIFEKIIEIEFKRVLDFIDEISNDLSRKQRELTNSINENLEVIHEIEESPDLDALFGDEIGKYFSHFPRFTYNSLLLTIYGSFENWLKKMCELDHDRKHRSLRVSDLAGNNYIEKSKKYLQKIAVIDFSSLHQEMIKIGEIQKIRNCIAHNNSNITSNNNASTSQQPLYQIISVNSYMELTASTGEFYIRNEQFLRELIVTMQTILKSILVQMDKLP